MPAREAAVCAKALALGFDAVGFARADAAHAATARLRVFLAAGRHGAMAWMENERRTVPAAGWGPARSVVVAGMNYGPPHDPLADLARTRHGSVAAYARGADYHGVMKRRLQELARWMAAEWESEARVFVDTAPVLEKPLAQAAGLGWQGKHTNLVSRELGSWLLLGEVFTTLELAGDEAGVDACGTCSRCLEVCPTDAFPAPYQLDARRCISYLTIEHKGHIAAEFRAAIGNRIYGCDDCLAVCPWNKYAQLAAEAALRPRVELTVPALAELAALDDESFRRVFAGSPIKRTGRDRFVRNVLIAIGNAGDPALLPAVRARLGDPSVLVRAMAAWALGRIDPQAFERERVDRARREEDADVRAEWGISSGGLIHATPG